MTPRPFQSNGKLRRLNAWLPLALALIILACAQPPPAALQAEPVPGAFLPAVSRPLPLGGWQFVASVGAPTARHENGYVNLDGRFYLVGGRGVKAVELFDPADATWRVARPTPVEMHHFQAVTVGAHIYVVGAYTGPFPFEQTINHIWIYDPATDIWSQGPAIDRPRGSAAAVVHDGAIYLVGGIIGGHGPHADAVPWLDAFDLATQTWTRLPDAPHARDHFHAAVLDGKLYAAGGRDTGTDNFADNTISPVDVYDFATGTWQTLPSPTGDILTQRAGAAVAVVAGELVVVGGEGFGVAWPTTEALDPVSAEWRPLAPLNQARHGTQIAACGDTLYIVAGSGAQGGAPELTTQEIFFYQAAQPCTP